METVITFLLNNEFIKTKIHSGTVLLDFIRKNKKLTGTKEVCKEGDCGACAVLLGEIENDRLKYKTINSCLFPLLKVQNKHIVTIEGLNLEDLNLIQKSFLEEGASQCGFCTPGFIISFTGYLINNTTFNKKNAINSIAGNICRCTGYHSIIRSIESVGKNLDKINFEKLIEKGIIPTYFEKVEDKLKKLIISRKFQLEGKSETIVSGGTDLFVQKPDSFQELDFQLSENIIKKEIKIENSFLYISGSSSLEELADFVKENETNIDFENLFRLFASLPIRNSATVAGNIVNASPIADITIVLLALETTLLLRNNDKSVREISLRKFFKDYKIIEKDKNEIIDQIKVRIPDGGTKFNFEKVSKRTHMDIASVNSAISIRDEDGVIKNISVSAGGVAPIPLYLDNFSNKLKGKEINNELFENFQNTLNKEINPISDIRGSAEYKKLLLSHLIIAHFLKLYPKRITSEVLI